MLFIIIYAITGWKIKTKNKSLELWNIWKKCAWMEVVVQILYTIFYDQRLSFNNPNLSIGMFLVIALIDALRYGALIMLYKGWKKYKDV